MSNIEHINEFDTLNAGREKINKALDGANAVLREATEKDIISAPEIIVARGGAQTLGERLDSDKAEFSAQLAQKAPYSTVWSMANMGQDVKEAMTNGSVAVVGKGAVLKENIVGKQVTPTKLSGHDNTDAQNVIDKDDLIRGGWVSYDSGEVIEGTSQGGFNCYSIYYPVSPGERWYKNDASQALIYDEQKNRVGGVDRRSRIVDIPDDGRLVRLTFVYEDTELYFSRSDSYTEPTFKIKHLEIESEKVVGKFSINQMDFIDYNLFDGQFTNEWYIDTFDNTLRETTNELMRTVIYEINPLETVYIGIEGEHNRFRVGLAESLSHMTPVSIQGDLDVPSTSLKIENTHYKYLVIQVSTQGEEPNLKISTKPIKSNRNISIGRYELVTKDELPNITRDTSKRYATYFEREIQPVDILPSHTDVYGLWDTMKAAFPNHLTKTLLGVNAQGNELYECKITMPQIRGVSKRRFKLGITCGMHGDERTPVYSIIDFAKELLGNPDENELLNAFKANIDLHIIPICNPTGYDANTRSNGQGVDINRNFTEGWVATGTPNVGYTTFSGVSPASELETQILEKWLADNKFDYVIDFHNGNPTQDFSYAVLDSRHIDVGDVYIRTLPKLSNSWARRFPNLPQNKQYGYVSVSDVAGVRAQAISTGATALTLEAGHTMFGMDSAKDGKYAQTFSKDLIFNYLAELHKVLFW